MSVIVVQQSTGGLFMSRSSVGLQGPAGPSLAVTGTGFVHVTSSSIDAAAKLVADADVASNAAIAVSKLAAGTNTYVLTTTGGVPVWAAASGGGITALTGDVTASGTGSVAATVVRVNGATVPAAGALVTGNSAYVSGASALTYSALNLGGGSGWVTGTLPSANQAAQTLGGALSGTTAAAVIVPGTAGQIFVSNATPVSAWTSLIKYETTHGRFLSGFGGSDAGAAIGPQVGSETTQAAVYLLPNATAPSSTNLALYSDGSSFLGFNVNSASGSFNWVTTASTNIAQLKTVVGSQVSLWLGSGAAFATGNVAFTSDAAGFTLLNCPSGGYIGFTINNASYLAQIGGTNMAFGGVLGVSAPFRIDYTTATTPLLQSGTSATGLTVGTNKTSGILNFQSGAALTALSLQNPGGSASLVLVKTTGQRQAAFRSTGSNYTVDSSGSGDEQIWMTAACVITLPAPSSCIGRVLEIIVGYDPAAGGGTIARNGTENINNAASNVTLVTGDKYSILQVRCDGTNWIIKGGLAI